MASIPMTGEPFEMGRVMSRTFGTIGRNALLLGGLIVVFYLLPSIIMQMTLMSPATPQAGNPLAALKMFTSPTYWVGFIVSILLYFFLQAAVTHVTLVDLDGRRPQLQPSLATALSCALPLFGLGILLTIACYVGLILLVVPGIILFTMWSVSGVALVAERTGVFTSFSRSQALTKGYRWPIFGLMIVVALMYGAFLMLVGFVSFASIHRTGGALVAPGIGVKLTSALGGAVLTLLTTVGFASIYAELRAVKEGASGASLANIFA